MGEMRTERDVSWLRMRGILLVYPRAGQFILISG